MRFQSNMGNVYRKGLNGGSHGVVPTRIVQVVLIAITLFIVVPSLFSRFSPSAPKQRPEIPLDKSSLAGHQLYLYPTGDKCRDPFLEPGYLSFNSELPSGNFWTPFNTECPPAPRYLQDVLDRRSLSWLQHKTVLMIGDSVDRNNLNFFCSLVNSSSVRVTSMTNFNETVIGDTDTDPTNKDPGDLTKPRICRVEEYDFEIINFFHFGLHEYEMWTEKKVYTAPGVYKERIPMLKKLMADYGRQPDMILLASGLWDLAGWVKEDAYAKASTHPNINPEKLTRWLENAEEFIAIVEEIFPDTFLMWRWLHYCLVDWGWWFLQEAPEWVDRSARAPFHQLRIYQLNSAYERFLERHPTIHKFAWGELLTGHMEEGIDSIHPAKEVGGVIWSDMILYYLSRLRPRLGETIGG